MEAMDAAESELQGDVDPLVATGCIRYRIWPAKRHKTRTFVAFCVVLGATSAVVYLYGSVVWSMVTFLGLTATLAMFLFPTLVALDGPVLHLRQLGAPRTYDLRLFKRLDVNDGIVPFAELGTTPSVSARDTVHGTVLPLPAKRQQREEVVVHLRRWVGRAPTGIFTMDDDHVPSDRPGSRDS